MTDKPQTLIEQLVAAKDRITDLESAQLTQAYLSAIIESADDAIVTKDLNGVITSWNPAAERIFSYTSKEIVGKPIKILEAPDQHDEEMILERLRKGERIDHYETQRQRKDGRVIDVSVTISPIRDKDGKVIGASKIARDISDRRTFANAQMYLTAIIESAEDAIIGKTLDNVVTSWNSGAETIFRYTAQEMIGRPIALLVPPDHPNEEPSILARLRKGERIEHYETQRIRKDGRIIDVSLTVSPIRNQDEIVVDASKIARNITERKRVEARERDALRQARIAREQAEAANRTKDKFLATVSHELRTPLTATLG